MAFELTSLTQLADADFSDLIDARSPAEFAEDHLPGALSLPVLDDAERARVGTMYVQQSRFEARKIGAALVLQNVARHIETTLKDRDRDWRPLVYCWRGGQRSGTFGWLLREIGWRTETLAGGYRSYRRLVVCDLYEAPVPHRLVVLDGMTCTAKTELLHLLAGQGMQVLDLEGLARHRGSIFGARAEPQPSQKQFESQIAQALARYDPDLPLLVEAESSKVGNLLVPPQLWRAMCTAPRVGIVAPLSARARFFLRAYDDLLADPARFQATIGKLRSLQGAARVESWQGQVAEGDFLSVAAGLMSDHYDPRYQKSSARHAHHRAARIDLPDLTQGALAEAVPELVEAVSRAARRG